MKFVNLKFAILFCLFLSFLFASCCFAKTLEITYPSLPNAQAPVSTKTFLPKYVNYIFTLAISLAGLIAFGSLIYGGVRYLTSVGSPTALSDAREQIFAGILGLIILLCSYLILSTINPQLVTMQPTLTPLQQGIELYPSQNCEDNPEISTDDPLKTAVSMPDLGGMTIKSVKFLSKPEELEVYFYKDKNWKGDQQRIEPGASEVCVNKELSDYKSVELRWKLPGVYLCKDEAGKECRVYQNSTASLRDFDNKAQWIRFRPWGDIQFGAVLHVDSDYRGMCRVYWQPVDGAGKPTDELQRIGYFEKEGEFDCRSGTCVFIPGPGTEENTNPMTSSLTIFTIKEKEELIGEGVSLFEQKDYGGEKWGPFELKPEDAWRFTTIGDFSRNLAGADENVRSVKIDGTYLAVLFADPGYCGECQVFKQSRPSFIGEPMQNCHHILGWNPADYWKLDPCASSLLIVGGVER